MTKQDGEVVVVGGGIIGAMCAWYLVKAGKRVVLIDQGKFGAACSHGNCGYISPSHVLPLTTPGAVVTALKSMLRPASPFYVKPRFSPSLWWWLLKFARRCNRHDMLAAGVGIHALLHSSADLYAELIEGEQLQCEWQRHGLMYVYLSQHHWEEFANTNQMIQEHYGVSAKPISAAELEQMEPALKPGLAGAWLFECDSHLRPDRLMTAMKALLEKNGVTIRESCEAQGVVKNGTRVVAVKTAQGDIAADHFVFAPGALTPFLKHSLGIKVPIQPGKGYSITMPRPQICPKYPMILEQHRVAITPMQSAYRIGSTMEFAGYDTRINQRRVDALRRGAEIYLREPFAEPVLETWYGWRPMTWDSLPFIDQAPIAANVWLAAGHNMLGLSTATATGKLVTEMMTGQAPHIDPVHYRLARVRG